MYQDLKIFPTSNIDSQFKEEDFFIVLEFSFLNGTYKTTISHKI